MNYPTTSCVEELYTYSNLDFSDMFAYINKYIISVLYFYISVIMRYLLHIRQY